MEASGVMGDETVVEEQEEPKARLRLFAVTVTRVELVLADDETGAWDVGDMSLEGEVDPQDYEMAEVKEVREIEARDVDERMLGLVPFRVGPHETRNVQMLIEAGEVDDPREDS